MHDAEVSDPLELLRCAQVNFDNLTTVNPAIATHPMYQIARTQFDEAVALLENDGVDQQGDPSSKQERDRRDRL